MSVADRTIDAVRALIEGSYAHQAWHMSTGVIHSPQLDGRFMLFNGVVTNLGIRAISSMIIWISLCSTTTERD